MALVVDADAGGGETFDEEAEEGDQVEIEQLVGEFVDEAPAIFFSAASIKSKISGFLIEIDLGILFSWVYLS